MKIRKTSRKILLERFWAESSKYLSAKFRKINFERSHFGISKDFLERFFRKILGCKFEIFKCSISKDITSEFLKIFSEKGYGRRVTGGGLGLWPSGHFCWGFRVMVGNPKNSKNALILLGV